MTEICIKISFNLHLNGYSGSKQGGRTHNVEQGKFREFFGRSYQGPIIVLLKSCGNIKKSEKKRLSALIMHFKNISFQRRSINLAKQLSRTFKMQDQYIAQGICSSENK